MVFCHSGFGSCGCAESSTHHILPSERLCLTVLGFLPPILTGSLLRGLCWKLRRPFSLPCFWKNPTNSIICIMVCLQRRQKVGQKRSWIFIQGWWTAVILGARIPPKTLIRRKKRTRNLRLLQVPSKHQQNLSNLIGSPVQHRRAIPSTESRQ